jgi:hypothetical protein
VARVYALDERRAARVHRSKARRWLGAFWSGAIGDPRLSGWAGRLLAESDAAALTDRDALPVSS